MFSRVEFDNDNFRTRLETLLKDLNDNGGEINKTERGKNPIKGKYSLSTSFSLPPVKFEV